MLGLLKRTLMVMKQWNKRFGGISYEYAYDIQQTTDGGYIVSGSTNSYGIDDAWLVKTDSNGNEQWNKTFGGLEREGAISVRQTIDGGYIFLGWTYSYGKGADDAWLVKTDSNGNEQWNKTYGGGLYDNSYSLQQTTDGGFIFSGNTNSYGSSKEAWLVKTDSNGNEIWNKRFVWTPFDNFYSVQQTLDGGYIAAGGINLLGYDDVVLLKTDSNGNEIWNKTFGGVLSWVFG